MTTNEIANIVITSMADRSFDAFLTTYHGQGIDEADVLGVNSNGFIYEYEIKRSRADFQAEFRNKISKHQKLKERRAIKTYDEWKRGKRTGKTYDNIMIPNRYYFVCKEGLIHVDEVPEYAGLVYVIGEELVEKKNAPLLHKVKANERIYKRIASILSQRIIYGCSFYTFKNK